MSDFMRYAFAVSNPRAHVVLTNFLEDEMPAPEFVMYGNQTTGEIRFFAEGATPRFPEDEEWTRIGPVRFELQIEIGARERPTPEEIDRA